MLITEKDINYFLFCQYFYKNFARKNDKTNCFTPTTTEQAISFDLVNSIFNNEYFDKTPISAEQIMHLFNKSVDKKDRQRMNSVYMSAIAVWSEYIDKIWENNYRVIAKDLELMVVIGKINYSVTIPWLLLKPDESLLPIYISDTSAKWNKSMRYGNLALQRSNDIVQKEFSVISISETGRILFNTYPIIRKDLVNAEREVVMFGSAMRDESLYYPNLNNCHSCEKKMECRLNV